MSTARIDTKKLELMTRVRADWVISCYELGDPVDWDEVESAVQRAVRELDLRRELEPFIQAGQSMRRLMDNLTDIYRSFAEGFSGRD